MVLVFWLFLRKSDNRNFSFKVYILNNCKWRITRNNISKSGAPGNRTPLKTLQCSLINNTKMINKILNFNIKNYFWLLFARKISRFFKIYFVPTNKKILPKNNHPLKNLDIFFNNQYKNFIKDNSNFNKDLYRGLIKNFSKNQRIKILDFGGENIDLYLFLKKKFSKIHIYVINQPKLNYHLQRFINKKKINGVTVLSNTDKLKNSKLDFVYFGSSLQYIKNYDKILKIILKKKIKYLYISATSYFKSKDFNDKIILKQVNLLPTELYCYCFNYHYIFSLFKCYGYTKISEKQNSYKKINFANFSFKINYLNILFKRNKK